MSQWAYPYEYGSYLRLPDVDEASQVGYSKGAEWYLSICLGYLMVEAVFGVSLVGILGPFISGAIGYVIMPAELYFLTIGMLVGVGIFLAGRSDANYTPTRGGWAFIAYWGVYSLGVIRGFLRGNPFWHVDMRCLLLTTIVVPWAAVLGRKVRLDIIFKRLIWLALPLAIVNAVRGYRFISIGPSVGAIGTEDIRALGMDLQCDFALVAAFCMALARSFCRNGKGVWMAGVLALGVIGPLSKPTIFAFVLVVIFIWMIGTYTGARSGIVGLMRANLAFVGVGIVLFIIVAVWFSQKGGVGLTFLEHRFFKTQVEESKRDYSTGRFDAWLYGFNVWLTNPVLGVGLGTRVPKIGRGIPFIDYHNQWVKSLVEMGIAGLGVLIFGFLAWVKRAIKALRFEYDPDRFWPRLAIICLVMVTAISSLVGEPLGGYVYSYIFWIMLALESAAHTEILSGALGAEGEPYEGSTGWENNSARSWPAESYS